MSPECYDDVAGEGLEGISQPHTKICSHLCVAILNQWVVKRPTSGKSNTGAYKWRLETCTQRSGPAVEPLVRSKPPYAEAERFLALDRPKERQICPVLADSL